MKIKKGTPGYLNYKLKAEIIRTIIYFALCIGIFLLGVWQTGNKENLLTVVAVVGVLPSSKALVSVIIRIPHRSIRTEVAEDIRVKSEHLTVLYDLVITSSEKVMPVCCIVISGNQIFGYTESQKVNLQHLETHIKTILEGNKIKAVVKIMNQYTPFITRVEGLNNIQAVEQNDTKEKEKNIAHLIKQISL